MSLTDSQPISGADFISKLKDAGIIRAGEKVRRVIIDADDQGLTILYLERIGDERLLEVIQEPGLDIAMRNVTGERIPLDTTNSDSRGFREHIRGPR